jgi:NAD(P)-dependent dehydrogenase (short-subunit alcohol dehydrogenase family)
MQLRGNTFLITGGGSGLGAACAREFTRSGANVVIADINSPLGESVAAEIGDRARFVRTDVTEEAGVQAAVEAAQETFGALHGAINCAGIGIAARVLGREGPHALAAFRQVIEVNLIGTFNVTRLAAAQMVQQEPIEGERGVIVNTASIAAYDGQIGQVAYASSKGGVVAMTLPVARDLAARLIRICTIAPGTMNTPMLALLPEETRQALADQIPHPKRLGEPSEYAALARHIIENAFLNGETIRLDGALRMPPK